MAKKKKRYRDNQNYLMMFIGTPIINCKDTVSGL